MMQQQTGKGLVRTSGFRIAPHEICVWQAHLDVGGAWFEACHAVLSGSESERASRFLFARDGRRFTVARGILRILLGRYLGLSPAAVEFCYGPSGKPTLDRATHGSDLTFNLSHSGDRALFAFAQQREIGIDLEEIRPQPDAESLARLLFSPRELEEFSRVPPHQKELAFFLGWTRKEAFIKAVGDGLSLPLKSFDVSLTPDQPAMVHATRRPLSHSHWHIVNLVIDPRFAGTLATSGTSFTVQYYVWPYA